MLAFSAIFPKQLGIFSPNLQAYYTFPSAPEYNFFYLIIANYDEVMPY